MKKINLALPKPKNKVYIVDLGTDCRGLFSHYNWEITTSLKDCDIIQFTGGADIDPSFYKQKKHPRTTHDQNRGKREKLIYALGIQANKPMAGICRGAQLINVLNGGNMWQHVDNHHGHHYIYDVVKDDVYNVNSIHHQMMIPSDDATIIANAYESTQRERYDQDGKLITNTDKEFDDAEIVYYEQTNTLCFQPHPEFAVGTPISDVYMEYVDKYLLKRK